ncbi:TRAP transporter small permease subunit [Oceanobacillus polygoni]|uniref:TRAP-type mannitol/chloroaromatic compound transport system permease small subunit n=1 Tax=Oceanobacillus polygoni TaxID=1235259 RepID=A0A9X1CE14_9BACI|nr:TRAP transporter small permease subunit [Oceanobacillus polygoni]MBP2075838.1 TRAP-type mannitol/chloroaromatic compound transport system permease small subunit [Oceanobacillus polygoni]
MKPIIKGIDSLSSIAGKISGYLIIPLTLVMIYTIIMRRIFSNSPDWGFEVSIFIFGISILLAGADVLRLKGHVAVDIIYAHLSERWGRIMYTFSLLIIIVVCSFLLFKGMEVAVESTRILEHSSHQSSFNPQIWWFKWFIPIGGLLLWLQAWAEIYKVWREGEQE